jgi:cytosine/uracil/thiamine/allantoin permease
VNPLPARAAFFCFVNIAVPSGWIILYGGQVLWSPWNLVDQWTNGPFTFFLSFPDNILMNL